MKIKIIVVVLGLSISSLSFADFGLIQDTDGYVNVRDQPSLNGKVTGKLQNQSIVFCLDEESTAQFCNAQYALKGEEGMGFIHKSRIHFFKDYQKQHLKGHTQFSAEYILGKNKVVVTVQPAVVAAQNFKKTKIKDTESIELTHYKNKRFRGVDNGLPTASHFYQLSKIEIDYAGKKLLIPLEQVEQFFIPNTPLLKGGLQDFEMAEIYSSGKNVYLIFSLATGGAAQYSLIIHSEDGKLKDIQSWNMNI